jgi:hypothetical protein
MLLIGNNFVPKTYTTTVYCGECNGRFPLGTVMLVSIRKGRVREKVCNEECRLKFDNHFWQTIAIRRTQRAK